MQKDVHFYLTYALARKVGICAKDAEIIAWSNQYTDDLTKAELHGIQTQSAILGNWGERQIQLSVLVPFHFIPGDDPDRPWVVTQNSPRANQLVRESLSDIFRLGIALHGLQDTFSHQGFSGWDEKLNACYPWYYIQSNLPNIGHAELGATPDIVSAIWTDPRTGTQIDNRYRALACAAATYSYLWQASPKKMMSWPEIFEQIETIFRINSYDERKATLHELARDKQIRYSKIKKKDGFITAARQHLAAFIKSL